jgi:hypothetical protein
MKDWPQKRRAALLGLCHLVCAAAEDAEKELPTNEFLLFASAALGCVVIAALAAGTSSRTAELVHSVNDPFFS